jgi:hypothetical protein
MPDRPDYFRCPLCRGVTCERVIVKRPNGTAYVTAFFSCTVCTLMFRDPRALTRGFEDRPRDRPHDRSSDASRNDSKSSVNRYQSWAKVNQDRKDRE